MPHPHVLLFPFQLCCGRNRPRHQRLYFLAAGRSGGVLADTWDGLVHLHNESTGDTCNDDDPQHTTKGTCNTHLTPHTGTATGAPGAQRLLNLLCTTFCYLL